MNSPGPPVLEIQGLEKRYQGLRPLRIGSLRVAPAERVAILNLESGMAEVLVNLVTGASVADRGVVCVQGQDNAGIANGDDWLASLDRFGIVSERAVLLEGATLEQNLAMPFTLQVDPLAPEMAARVARLASECGLMAGGEELLQRRAGDIPPEMRARAHLARAVALDPVLLVFEHPTAGVPEDAQPAYAADIVRVLDRRGVAALVLTQDQAFGQRVAHRTLKLNPASGALTPVKRGWFT